MRIAVLFIFLTILTACAVPGAREQHQEPSPGRISQDRHLRDQKTCHRMQDMVVNDAGFLFEISRDCHVAFAQILDANTSLASFDVARAYLDALHDFVNTADFLHAQGEDRRISSDVSAYLIAQQTGLIGAMQDWRFQHGMRRYPAVYQPVRQIMV